METGLPVKSYSSGRNRFKIKLVKIFTKYVHLKFEINLNFINSVCYIVVTTSIDSAGSDLGQVHNAFFIGIEEEAKERLERLAASKRITPVDITKLAHQVNFKVF